MPAEDHGVDYASGAHLYLDARVESAMPTGECVAPMPPVLLPATAAVCAELFVWFDTNADGYIQAEERQMSCRQTSPFEVILVPLTGSWGTTGVWLQNAATFVYTDPISVTMSNCDVATGHYHGDEVLVFGTRDVEFQMEADVCGTWNWLGIEETECVHDEDIY